MIGPKLAYIVHCPLQPSVNSFLCYWSKHNSVLTLVPLLYVEALCFLLLYIDYTGTYTFIPVLLAGIQSCYLIVY